MKQCSGCEQFVSKIHRRYFGKTYCTDCYQYLFPSKKCKVCGKFKRIFRHEPSEKCQQCMLKEMPCHRCGKLDYPLGKITIYGPVCNSCSPYYRQIKCCFLCGLASRTVSRYLMLGELEPICFQCVKARHFKKCVGCKEIKRPYLSNLDRSSLCKECTVRPFKQCVVCNKKIPSGAYGRKCSNCFAEETLVKRIKVNKVGLSKYIAQLYEEYSAWLSHRRGAAHASRQILNDRQIFECLDYSFRKNGRMPDYRKFIRDLFNADTRQSTLSKKFFAEKDLFSADKCLYQDIDEKNRIRRLINSFSYVGCYPSDIFLRYYRTLLCRYRQGKISIRSVRLALSPAAEIVRLALLQHKEKFDQELLNQYLWLHLGQRNASYSFVSYLRRQEMLELKVPSKEYFTLPNTNESKKRLKLQLIALLAKEMVFSIRFLELGMAYFHGCKLPKELCKIELYRNCKTGDEFYTIYFAKLAYTLPNPNIAVSSFAYKR